MVATIAARNTRQPRRRKFTREYTQEKNLTAAAIVTKDSSHPLKRKVMKESTKRKVYTAAAFATKGSIPHQRKDDTNILSPVMVIMIDTKLTQFYVQLIIPTNKCTNVTHY